MRENESDGAGGWWQPPERGARGRAGPARTRLPAPDSDYPDTIAFGTPAGESRLRKPGRLREPGRLRDQGGTETRAATRARAARRPGGEAHPAGRRPIPRRGGVPPGAGGCWSTWPSPRWRRASAPGRPSRSAATGAAPAAGVSSSDVPGPHDNASGSGASAAPLNPEDGAEEGGSRPGRHHVEPQVQRRDGRGHRDDHFSLGSRADQQPRDRRGHQRARQPGDARRTSPSRPRSSATTPPTTWRCSSSRARPG